MVEVATQEYCLCSLYLENLQIMALALILIFVAMPLLILASFFPDKWHMSIFK